MELYFLRHAIAADKRPGGKDSERPLTPDGIEKMKRAAQGMRALGIKPHRIFSSPYVRARETAELTAAGLGYKGSIDLWQSLTPDGSLKDLLNDLKPLSPDKTFLMVGHEPSISFFVSQLLTGTDNVQLNFDKGGLCHLHFELMANEANASLLSFMDNETLRRLT